MMQVVKDVAARKIETDLGLVVKENDCEFLVGRQKFDCPDH